MKLNSRSKTFWTVQGTGVQAFHESYDVLYFDGTHRHFDIDFAVNTLGNDCVTKIVSTFA